MKTSTNLKRVLFALVFAAYSAIFFSGCLVDRDHHDDHGHDDHHDWHDDHHDDHH